MTHYVNNGPIFRRNEVSVTVMVFCLWQRAKILQQITGKYCS